MPAPHHSVFTGLMPFLPPNQQYHSTEGTSMSIALNWVERGMCIPLCLLKSASKVLISYTMYRTVFNFNRWESIKGFINGLGKLSLHYILKVCKVKFYYCILITHCFWIYFGCTTVTVMLLMTACVMCLARGMRMLMLSTV